MLFMRAHARVYIIRRKDLKFKSFFFLNFLKIFAIIIIENEKDTVQQSWAHNVS